LCTSKDKTGISGISIQLFNNNPKKFLSNMVFDTHTCNRRLLSTVIAKDDGERKKAGLSFGDFAHLNFFPEFSGDNEIL